jgi:hypothetical protein
MNVLIVMEEIPENIKFFLIENPTDKELQMLQQANNTFINHDSNVATNNVVSAFSPDEYKDTCECDEGWAGKWNKCEVKTPIVKQIEQVYNVGFFV